MGLITKIYLSLRRNGLRNSLDILTCTVKRELGDRSYRFYEQKDLVCILPGEFRQVEFQDGGANFQFENSNLEVKFLADDLIRLTWEPGRLPPPYAIAKSDWGIVPLDIDEIQDGWRLASTRFSLTINRSGAIRLVDQIGKTIRQELPPIQVKPSGSRSERDHTGWIHVIPAEQDTAVYGLGERASRLNLYGGQYRMWNRDPEGLYQPGDDPLYICIPVYLARHTQGSYLVFYENSYPAIFSFGKEDLVAQKLLLSANLSVTDVATEQVITTRFEGGALRYYLIAGPLESILERYSELTSKPPLPPRWALGYHQSRWGYNCQDDIQEVAAGFKSHELPLSAIHLDIDYMDGYRVFTVDRDRFPDLNGLARRLIEDEIRIVPILDPGVKIDPSYHIYQEGVNEGLFCKTNEGQIQRGIVWPGWAAFPDFTNPRTRKWWGKNYRGLIEQGASGFWHDMNEPSSFTAWGDMTLPRSTRHDFEGVGGDHHLGHNLYGLLMNKAGYESFAENKRDYRPWFLTRSGWAGISRYAWTWTADTGSSWEALRQVIPTILGLSLSGVQYSGSDIGGFSGDPDPELYLRWFQMSAFLPFFRTHSSIESPPREPWQFNEPTLKIIREFLKLRYRLLPYLYTLAWRASQTGLPLVRPIFWVDENDPRLSSIDTEFMLGESLLIAPVLEAGVRSRTVKLPGGEWFDFWEERVYSGPGEITVPVTQGRIPVFVKSGTLLEMEYKRTLELWVYPLWHGERTSTLYSDLGDGDGLARLDNFRMEGMENKVNISWDSSGQYPFPYDSVVLKFPQYKVVTCLLDGAPAPILEHEVVASQFQHAVIGFAR
jgi:alpha-glucosidase